MSTTVAQDPRLPTLSAALDADRLRDVLTGGQPAVISVDVLAHKAGRRCALRYRVERPTGTRTLIGKVYTSARRAERMHERLVAGARVFANERLLGVPTPVAFVPELGLSLQEAVDGTDLRTSLDDPAPFEAAARWLVALHESRPMEGLRVYDALGRHARLEEFADTCSPFLSERDVARVDGVLDVLREQAQHAPRASAMIHKDFYYANALWDGRRLVGLDLDQLAYGDPAFDVGHFLAHLQRLAYVQTGRRDAARSANEAFLESYTAEAAGDVRPRIEFYVAYTFFKLAATEVERARAGFVAAARDLVGFACREIEGGA